LLLRQMRLARPPARLDRRVWSAMVGRRGGVQGLVTVIAAAAAVIVLAGPLVLHRFQRSYVARIDAPDRPSIVRMVAATSSRPLRVERDASRLADRGIVGFSGNVPLHGYRRECVRQIWYFDAKRRSYLCVTVPREQVVLVPVHPF